MSTLRVAFLGHSAKLSGAELSLVELVAAFEDVEPLVVLAEDGPLVERLEQGGAMVDVLPLGREVRDMRRESLRPTGARLLLAGASTATYSARLARRLRALRVDLVHANTLKALLYGAAAAKLTRTPLVWHAHDRISEDYLPPAAVRLVRHAARNATRGVIANSKATLETIGPLNHPTAIVPEPVRVDAFRIRRRRSPKEPFTVAMVGRIAPWKGQDVFLRAFASAFPDGEERGVVVGAPLFGEEEYERSLRELVAQLGLGDRIELLGFSDDVAAELASVDALVHASVIPEPFGRVIVEGMAAGLPVVAAADGGPTEIVTDGVDGLLYPPGDIAALAGNLRRLAGDPEVADRLGRAATERARAFSPALAAATAAELYRRVLSEREAAAA
ncbi:MAG TPA: glycosyltransferase family 4 protein [Gaiellaceae bacterium]